MATAIITNQNWLDRKWVQTRAENRVHLQFRVLGAVTGGQVVMLTSLPWGSKVLDAYYDIAVTGGGSAACALGVYPASNLVGTTLTAAGGGDVDGLIPSISIVSAVTPCTRAATVGALLGHDLNEVAIASGGSAFTTATDKGEPVLVALTVSATSQATTDIYVNLIVEYGTATS